MCGIVGIVPRQSAAPPAEEALRQMLAMIRHRGPDQFGVYLDEHAGLGSARLSIIDCSGGQQPIGNQDGSRWIVFNGEIFNYLELRAELEAAGHRFRTRSDTEVVLHAYDEFGPDCLNKLNGQFAIAIWDRIQQQLFLARDRLGVRPLFFTHSGGALIFASEIKAILANDGVRAELDPLVLEQIFTFWSALSPRTIFRGIQELPPGHYLLARHGETVVRPYWTLRFPAADECSVSRSLEDYVEEFRALLTDAVRIRLRADVPVGAYLSGGLDSSTIAAIIRRLGVSHLDTFSIAFNDQQFDESAFQRRMAQYLGTEHQVIEISHADIGQVFPDVIWHTETPLMRTAPAPMFLLSKLVRSRKYKVVLTGEGADEFLAGYDIFKEAMIRRFWSRQPGSRWRPLLLQRLYPDIGGLATTAAAYRQAFFGTGLEDAGDPFYSHAIRWRNNGRTRRFFSDEIRNRIATERASANDRPVLPDEFAAWHPLARAQFLEISVFLSQYLLSSQGDRPAMAHSVEGRYPFLDFRIVEFCNLLPARLKLSGLTEKHLLRRTARDWLPEEIWRRGKRPYRAPIHRSFFSDRTHDYVRDLLEPGSIRAAGMFNPSAVERLVAKIKLGHALGETDDMALVGILSAQLVHRLFIEDFHRPPPLDGVDDVKVMDFRASRSRRDVRAVA